MPRQLVVLVLQGNHWVNDEAEAAREYKARTGEHAIKRRRLRVSTVSLGYPPASSPLGAEIPKERADRERGGPRRGCQYNPQPVVHGADNPVITAKVHVNTQERTQRQTQPKRAAIANNGEPDGVQCPYVHVT